MSPGTTVFSRLERLNVPWETLLFSEGLLVHLLERSQSALGFWVLITHMPVLERTVSIHSGILPANGDLDDDVATWKNFKEQTAVGWTLLLLTDSSENITAAFICVLTFYLLLNCFLSFRTWLVIFNQMAVDLFSGLSVFSLTFLIFNFDGLNFESQFVISLRKALLSVFSPH